MIHAKISRSKQVNSMSDFSQLLFTWSIAHADDFGFMDGDPDVVLATVVPMRRDKDADDVEQSIQEWVDSDLVEWYEVNEKQIIWFKTWERHQSLSKRTKSSFAPPPGMSGKALNASEKQIENAIASALSTGGIKVGDYEVIQVDQQVRIENSYLDIVARTSVGTSILFEVKRGRLTKAALMQIRKYRSLVEQKSSEKPVCILIGYGLASNFPMDDAKASAVNVVTYNDDLQMTLINEANIRYLTVNNDLHAVIPSQKQQNLTELNRTELNRSEPKEKTPTLSENKQMDLDTYCQAVEHQMIACGASPGYIAKDNSYDSIKKFYDNAVPIDFVRSGIVQAYAGKSTISTFAYCGKIIEDMWARELAKQRPTELIQMDVTVAKLPPSTKVDRGFLAEYAMTEG